MYCQKRNSEFNASLESIELSASSAIKLVSADSQRPCPIRHVGILYIPSNWLQLAG